MENGAAAEAAILESWRANAGAWVTAVREGWIESRRRVTDRAVVDAVLSRTPKSVLDVGCGEGWLARDLAARDVRVTGVDVVPELVDAARQAGGGDFLLAGYADLARVLAGARFDVVVCNFSLLGKTSTEDVIRAVPGLLEADGALVVQTLHPLAAAESRGPSASGWRQGGWPVPGALRPDPVPWFFRTPADWADRFESHGLGPTRVREPVDPVTGVPASLLFLAACHRGQRKEP